MKLIKKKEFAVAIFDSDYKVFIIYVIVFHNNSNVGNEVHSLSKTQIALLKKDEASIKVFNIYANFIDIFSQSWL